MTHRGAVSESFYLEAPYFNRGIAYQTKAKRLSEMTVTTKKPQIMSTGDLVIYYIFRANIENQRYFGAAPLPILNLYHK